MKYNKCPQCGKIEYTPDCQYCNENRYLPKERTVGERSSKIKPRVIIMDAKQKAIKILSGNISQYFWDTNYKILHKAIDTAIKEAKKEVLDDRKDFLHDAKKLIYELIDKAFQDITIKKDKEVEE